MRIVCSHEHFVSLNLPPINPADLFMLSGGASSPSPSIRSNDSQSSFITYNTSSSEKSHWAELTPDFRRKHFLVGLALSLLSNSMDQASAEVHSRAVNILRNLMTSHDLDPR